MKVNNCCHRSFLVLFGIVGLTTIGLSGCAILGGVGKSDEADNANAPPHVKAEANANEVQRKYYDFEPMAGIVRCVPKGKLAELTGEPYKCHQNLDSCGASLDAARGTLDPEFNTLFADLLKVDQGESNKVKFLYECPGEGPKQLDTLALQGLGYTHSAEHVDAVMALAEPQVVAKMGFQQRELLAKTIWRMQDAERGVPALQNLLNAGGRTLLFKSLALQYLNRWDSDAGVDFCINNLPDDRHVISDCLAYLGNRQATEGYETIVQLLELYPKEGVRALGHMGDPRALPLVQDYLSKQKSTGRIIPIVALINLGETSHWGELKRFMDGKLDAKDKRMQESVAWDGIMETVAITNPDMEKKVNDELRKIANTKAAEDEGYDGWKPRTYAAIALAQRGDSEGISKLIELLEGTDVKARNAVLSAIGGEDDDLNNTPWGIRGLGVVGDEALVEPLLKFYERETDKGIKASILHTIATIRAAAAARGGQVAANAN